MDPSHAAQGDPAKCAVDEVGSHILRGEDGERPLAEALVTALELSIKQHAMGAAPWTPAAKPTGSGGQYTIAARKNPPASGHRN